MQRLLSHPLTIVLFTAIALIFFVSLEKNAQTAQSSMEALEALESQNEALAVDVKNLEEKSTVAKTQFAQEKIIRNELLLQKPGEYVVQLPSELKQTDLKNDQTTPETPWESWKKILL